MSDDCSSDTVRNKVHIQYIDRDLLLSFYQFSLCMVLCVYVGVCESVSVRESTFQRKVFVLGNVSLSLIIRQIENIQAHLEYVF